MFSISGSFIHLDSIYLAPPDLLSLVLGLSILRLGAFHHSLWGISFSNFCSQTHIWAVFISPFGFIRHLHSASSSAISLDFTSLSCRISPVLSHSNVPSQSSSSSSSSPALLHHLPLILMSDSRFISFLSTSFGDIPALSWVYFFFRTRIPLFRPTVFHSFWPIRILHN